MINLCHLKKQSLLKTNEKFDVEELSRAVVKMTVKYKTFVLVAGYDGADYVPQVWDMPVDVFEQLKKLANEGQPISGVQFKVTRTGQKAQTKYDIRAAIEKAFNEREKLLSACQAALAKQEKPHG